MARFFVMALYLVSFSAALGQQAVNITVDAGASGVAYHPAWNWFGADEPNYLTTPGGLALLRELSGLSPGTSVYFRPHNLLTTGDGTPALKWGSTNVYTEDAEGRAVYDWTITDQLFDAMVHSGVTPFVEIGFTPKALSPHPDPYQHSFPNGDVFTGWSYPPKDDARWSALITAWVHHLRSRYGKQVEQWRWEVWNEPDIAYFHGTPAQYFHLYDITTAAVRRALPHALVGGPAATGPRADSTFLHSFLQHCASGSNAAGGTGAPLDFITFHPKGSPKVTDDKTGQVVDHLSSDSPRNTHVQLGISSQLNSARNGFAIVASFPQFAHLPIILSESDPEGCAACLGATSPYRNSEGYGASVLEATARTAELANQAHVNLLGAVNWSFLFPGQPPFAGFRELATALPDPSQPILDKPVLNALRLLGALGGEQLPSTGTAPAEQLLTPGPHSGVDVLATRRPNQSKSVQEIDVLVWNYSDSLAPASPTPITLTLTNMPGTGPHLLPSDGLRLTRTLLDHDHGDAYTAWQHMGSPRDPTLAQVSGLLAAAKLVPVEDKAFDIASAADGNSWRKVHLDLAPNATVLLRFTWR